MIKKRFPVLEHASDALPKRTTVGAWVDLQLCSPPRQKQKKAATAGVTTGETRGSSSSSSSRSKIRRPAKNSAVNTASSRSRSSAKRATRKKKTARSTHPQKNEGVGNDEAAPSLYFQATTPSAGSNSGVGFSDGKNHASSKGTGIDSGKAGKPKAVPAGSATTSGATPFVLVDVEGTQSRDRGSADGMEFDSRYG